MARVHGTRVCMSYRYAQIVIGTSEFHVPTRVSFGAGALMSLAPVAGPLLLVTSRSVLEETVNELVTRWSVNCADVVRIDKPAGEPTSIDVDKAFSGLPRGLATVVGIGGGSTLDFAKALALLAVCGGNITDFEFGERKVERALPLYLAPTTCGSGSEVTPYCVVTNSATGRKFTITHSALRPVQAAVDPELLLPLPVSIRLATALDAFIHCLEAVLTRADSQVIAPIAEAGLKIGWRRLAEAGSTKPSETLVVELAKMSLFGGICISHSRTGLIHTLTVAFAEFVDIPHGLLNAYLLPYALAHNLSGYHGLLAEVVVGFTGEPVTSDEVAYDWLISWLEALIGRQPPFSAATIRERQDRIVRRILQDQGLPAVSHGVIDVSSVNTLVGKIADAAR